MYFDNLTICVQYLFKNSGYVVCTFTSIFKLTTFCSSLGIISPVATLFRVNAAKSPKGDRQIFLFLENSVPCNT